MNNLKTTLLFFGVMFKLSLASAFSYSHNDFKFDANGYVGYKYVTASQQHSVLHSAPELGLTLSAQYGNHWSAYTQFAYDEQLDRSLIYSFLAYDTQLTDDVTITLKGGK